MKRILLFLCIVFCVSLFRICLAHADLNFTVSQITVNDNNDYDPSLYGERIAWTQEGYNNLLGTYYTNIFYWDGYDTETQITDHTDSEQDTAFNPSLYEGTIAWESRTGIGYWDGTSIQKITNNWQRDMAPSLYDGNIAWFFDSDFTPQIYYRDGNTTTIIPINKAGFPSLYDGNIAFADSGELSPDSTEIFLWDGNAITQITGNSYDDRAPSLYAGSIAWEGYDGNDTEIYLWDGNSIIQITNNNIDDRYPSLHDGNIVWQSYDINDYANNEIFFWDGSVITQVTNNSYYDGNPSLHAGNIAWSGYDGNDLEIFYATQTFKIITDNDSPSGTWKASDGKNPYGPDSLYSRARGSSYTFETEADGYYEVDLRWTGYPSRCPDVPVKIYDGDSLLASTSVNQMEKTGVWNPIGSYRFNGTAKVVITAQSGCSTCADAVRLLAADAPELERIEIEGLNAIDENSVTEFRCRAYYSNGYNQTVATAAWGLESQYAEISPNGVLTTYTVDSNRTCMLSVSYSENGITQTDTHNITIMDSVTPESITLDNGPPEGRWKLSGGADPYGEESLYCKYRGETYSFETPATGLYHVYIWWTEYRSRCVSVPVEIYDGNSLIAELDVNQRENGGRWHMLGTFEFGGTAEIAVVSRGGCSTCADAVKLVPAYGEIIIDNDKYGTSSAGVWRISGGSSPYGENSRYNKTTGDEYMFEAPISGPYEVSIWWTEYRSRCTDVPVKIYDGNDLIDTFSVNQKQNGGRWNVQNVYNFTGKAKVVIEAQTGCSTCADAVKFTP